MSWPRMVARWSAVATMVVAFAVAVMLCIRVGLTAAENLDEGTRTLRNVGVAAIEKADANDLRAIATTIAIAAGIAIAWYKLDIFREFEPHLTITQTVESKPIGNSYALVVVTATLTNNSKVQVKPRQGYCRLAQTSPLDDAEIVTLYQEALARDDTTEFEQVDWPGLYDIRQNWQDGDISIEPGEQHQETYQFVIVRSTDSVVALTVIYNPLYGIGNRNRAESWRCYTFHDVLRV